MCGVRRLEHCRDKFIEIETEQFVDLAGSPVDTIKWVSTAAFATTKRVGTSLSVERIVAAFTAQLVVAIAGDQAVVTDAPVELVVTGSTDQPVVVASIWLVSKRMQAVRKWGKSVVEGYALEPHHVWLLTLAAEAWEHGQQSREALQVRPPLGRILLGLTAMELMERKPGGCG